MPNRTWTDEDDNEWMSVDIPQGAHGNLLVGIREDPGCTEYEDDYSHEYCESHDQDLCLASEFIFDKRGLTATPRKEHFAVASHNYRIINFPAFFTAEEVEAAQAAVNRSQVAWAERERGRYVSFPIHTSRQNDGTGSPNRERVNLNFLSDRQYETYMERIRASYDALIRNIEHGSEPQAYTSDELTPAEPTEPVPPVDPELIAREAFERNIEQTYGTNRVTHEAALRLYRDSDWSWLSDARTMQESVRFPLPEPAPEAPIDFTFPDLPRRATHYSVDENTDFTEWM